jgi:hypothetical protein
METLFNDAYSNFPSWAPAPFTSVVGLAHQSYGFVLGITLWLDRTSSGRHNILSLAVDV